MLSRALGIWLLLLIVSVANGAIREVLITPRFGEQGGHIGSTAILCAAIILVAWFSISPDWTQGQTRGFRDSNSVGRPHRRF
jgi:hypothetical protein